MDIESKVNGSFRELWLESGAHVAVFDSLVYFSIIVSFKFELIDGNSLFAFGKYMENPLQYNDFITFHFTTL